MEYDPKTATLRGIHNFRDMGGHPTAGGCRVRKGLIFRSGVMTNLPAGDGPALCELGVAAIFDLRDNEERARKPTRWHEDSSVAYHYRDHEQSLGDLRQTLRRGALTSQWSAAFMVDIYRTLPFEQAASYRRVMALLVEGSVPLIFNCAAGKDRTGVLAALILHALGVDRTAIDDDYLLSNAVAPELVAIMTNDPRYPGLATLPEANYLPVVRAEPGYLAAAFAAIEAECGSIDAYLAAQLGLGPSERKALRERLLEP